MIFAQRFFLDTDFLDRLIDIRECSWKLIMFKYDIR